MSIYVSCVCNIRGELEYELCLVMHNVLKCEWLGWNMGCGYLYVGCWNTGGV